jgi:hypothetical protein
VSRYKSRLSVEEWSVGLACKRNEILWSSTPSDKADGRDVDHGTWGAK